jgi:2-methylcitrate dehydratase PrpD
MVDSITIEMRGRGHSGPLPKSGLDGKFSVEYCAALALLDGHVGIDSFTDQRRFSPDMEDTLRKIRVESRDQGPGGVRATAQLKDGRMVSEECHGYRGSSHNPMSREERLEKVRDCLRRVLADQDAERLIALIEDLENVADVTAIMEILGQKSRVEA